MVAASLNRIRRQIGGAPWTPAEIAGLVGWFDASDSDTISVDESDTIIEIVNKANEADKMIAHPTYGAPQYVASEASIGSKPAFVWPTSQNDLGLTLEYDVSCSEVFWVGQYKDGLDAIFDNYVTFFTPLTLGGTARTIGHGGQDYIYASKRASINGAAFSGTVLPLPLSCLRFSTTDTTTIDLASIGLRTDVANRSWQGAICEVLYFGSATTLTADEVSQIETYLTDKWGL